MESGFKMEIVLEYSKVFDDEPTLESLLEGISRNTLLQMSTFFLGFSNQRSKYNSIREFIEMYFQAKNNAFANEVFAKIVAYQKSTIAKVIVPFHLTSLILFEYAFQNLDEVETLSEAEIEINFFKAYLLINEQNAIKANSVFASVEKVKKDEPRLSETVFTMAYADSDLINYDLFQILTAQTVKSIMLFEMLEKNQKTQLLLASFLEYYESDNWKEYIKSLGTKSLNCTI